MNIRLPAVDGEFYPSEKFKLESTLETLFEKAKGISSLKGSDKQKLKALVVPHAGYIYSGIVAAAGFNLVKPENFRRNPKILLLGPSHHADFYSLGATSAKEWQTPLGNVKIDSLNQKILKKYPKIVEYQDDAHTDEHCLEVEIPFLQKIFDNKFTLIPLLTGQGRSAEILPIFENIIKEIDLLVVSSDLSHYYPYELTIKIDKVANTAIPHADFKTVAEEVEACGKTAILTLIQLANEYHWQGTLIDYRNSGDTGGERDSAVGYGCYAFYE